MKIKEIRRRKIDVEDTIMKNTKGLVINGRQIVNGLCIIGVVAAIMALVVGIVFADSHLIGEASKLAVFASIICCLNYIGAKKDKEAKKNEVNA